MLHLSSPIPAVAQLQSEGLPIRVGHRSTAKTVALLNLMPMKQATELDLCRMLVTSGEDVNLTLLKLPNISYKTTPQAYMDAHYVDFQPQSCPNIDGLIITGAPLEHLEFEEVRHWSSLCQLMDWSITNVHCTLNICWAAQAALYHHYGVPKYGLTKKKFGVFLQQIYHTKHPLMQGLSNSFPMPHSRHTTVSPSDLPQQIKVLSGEHQSELSIMCDDELRQVFVLGHLEYAPHTLDTEYHRDVQRGLPITLPHNYYHNDDPTQGIDFSWHQSALTFYHNWLRNL